MWIHIPTSTLTSAPEQECLEKQLKSLSAAEYKPLLTLSGKPTRQPLSWRGWKTRHWITRLSGMMYTVSQAQSLAISWIESHGLSVSQPDTHANHSASPVSVLEKTIHDIYGQELLHSLSEINPNSVFLRTCPDTCDLDSTTSAQTFSEWVTRLRRDCLQRQKLAQRTKESACSSWGTPNTGNGKRGALPPNGKRGKDLQYQMSLWGTPRVTTNGGIGNPERIDAKSRLEDHAAAWPTPTSRDQKGQTQRGTAKPMDALPNAVKYHYLRQHQTMPKHGIKSSPSIRVLNPQFVEMLMGWPIGWTDSDSPVTGFAHWRHLMRFSLLRLLYLTTKGTSHEPTDR